MNATQIAERFGKAKTAAAIHDLVRECAPRRAEIRERIQAISDTTPPYQQPPARLQAIRKGPAAVQALDDAIKELEREHAYLDVLETELSSAYERELNREHAERIPGALRALPQAAAHVRACLATLDEAIEQLNVLIATAGHYDACAMPFPLDDGELANLAELRADVWKVRTCDILTPPALFDRREEFPLSFDLLLERVGHNEYMPRHPPAQLNPLHYTTGDVQNPRARIYG